LFLVILGKLAFTLLAAALKKSPDQMIISGLLAGCFGLAVNAFMIDIFEASKVAFTLWMVMGIAIGYLTSQKTVSPPVVTAKSKLKVKTKRK